MVIMPPERFALFVCGARSAWPCVKLTSIHGLNLNPTRPPLTWSPSHIEKRETNLFLWKPHTGTSGFETGTHCATAPSLFHSFSAGSVFIRQNVTSEDVRFWRLKTVPALHGVILVYYVGAYSVNSQAIFVKFRKQYYHLATTLNIWHDMTFYPI